MSKISRIRILNLGYNHDTIKIDDETFDFGGESTLISLRNGGGKSVLVQMIMSQFVNKSFRDLGDRQFKSYFTSNRPTFIMTEWQLDNNITRFISGMMVRKNQKEDNDAEELEMYTFTGSYSAACCYDIDNIPVVKQEENRRILKGFVECRNLLDNISKDKNGDFRLYDMGSSYGRRQYFATLRQYQINNKEWESIIRKVNQKESGLSELFSNSKDEKELVVNWFLRPIEDKLNQEKNRIDEFRKLTFQFIEQYRSNQSKIEKKSLVEKYFEDTKPLKDDIDRYVALYEDKCEYTAKMAAYVKKLNDTISDLTSGIEEKNNSLADIKNIINQIIYEKISYEIYHYYDSKEEVVSERTQQEAEITRLSYVNDKLARQKCVYDCNKLYLELKDIKTEKAEVEEKIDILLKDSENNRAEIEKIGHALYEHYSLAVKNSIQKNEINDNSISDTENALNKYINDKKDNEKIIRQKSTETGSLQNSVDSYNDAEEKFNTRFHCDIKRNILGLYEEGTLEVRKKEFDEEKQEESNRLSRLYKKKNELDIKTKMLSQEEVDIAGKLSDVKHEISDQNNLLMDYEQQKSYRLRVIKYAGLKESDIDRTDIIINSLANKLQELEIDKKKLIMAQSGLEKQHEQLKEGKTIELPDNVINYCMQNDIRYVYGMEWLNKNSRKLDDKARLVENNPFIPYSVIMEKTAFERMRNIDEKLYTSFPIPIIIKEDLEKTTGTINGNITTYGNVHFFIMFNNRLLDKAELDKMLEEIQDRISNLTDKLQAKNNDIETYNKYRIGIEEQTFSMDAVASAKKKVSECNEEEAQLKQRQAQIRSEKDSISAEYEENNRSIRSSENIITNYNIRSDEFDKLCEKYKLYNMNLKSLIRLQNELKELENKNRSFDNEIATNRDELMNLKSKRAKLKEIIDSNKIKTEEFKIYKENNCTESDSNIVPEEYEAKYYALTKVVSDSFDELNGRLKKLTVRVTTKEKDLAKKNYKHIAEEEYKNIYCSEEQYDQLEEQIKKNGVSLNAAIESNDKLAGVLAGINKDIEYGFRRLNEQTGYKELLPKETIVDTEFDKRINLRKHDIGIIRKEIGNLEARKNELSGKLSGVSEYADVKIYVIQDKMSEIFNDIPDLMTIEKTELDRYQADMRRKLSSIKEQLSKEQNDISEMIRNIAGKNEYQDAYFKKTFESLLVQVGNPQNLSKQYAINRATYESQLEKLIIDLANIDSEQKNVEEMFLEYIKNVNANIAMVDKNSTINVRGRNIKMLRIQVPDWESEKEHYKIQLHEFFERVVRHGIETIENNKNLAEYIGSIISTKNLYDDVIGIGNIKIKLYKIEAEKEVPISWAEVSSNSGGEGFLSAFVILTCLLSYMRRDENDLFSTAEEGKVLIMDNPFAQTYSAHLLKPLMEMAKKTNTQLICLSGLGGDSIYNRFDNIYVLKLVDSNIRKGVQRVEGEHIKGEEVKKMVLSDFKTEQMDLFEMVEE
ncbi:hypothetical protein [Eubacterium ventriosum]|jgi:hypothetical protein|uniref:Chromosome segregation ATPase n=1 Tax=Eubacterium ventriosum TaxID=39496 RepID=A0A414RAT0_9FIRM|nr:hypothetical protein [Eubacterium ventriosum]RHF90153.1 hypothetical protein DW652_02370 [Eubacterium ventriosum]